MQPPAPTTLAPFPPAVPLPRRKIRGNSHSRARVHVCDEAYRRHRFRGRNDNQITPELNPGLVPENDAERARPSANPEVIRIVVDILARDGGILRESIEHVNLRNDDGIRP